jgi:GDP-mannose 6-dehydrogenase
VTGVDINPLKIEPVAAGRSPVIEAGLDELIREAVGAGRLSATTDVTAAVEAADVLLICVGTPSDGNGQLNFSYVDRVCQQIGEALRCGSGYPVVVIRSTVLPGSTQSRFIPILERASGRCAGRDFGVAMNPEFLREGSAVDDFFHPSFTLIGEYDERGAQQLADVYAALPAEALRVPLPVAEMVKYASNAFHAVKVCFANEIGNLCKARGIDSQQVMDIVCLDRRLNLSPYYLRPGFAFGGSCLPKDLRALLYQGHHLDLQLPLLEAILPSNERQIRLAFDLIRQTGCKRVGVLGFSFKAGTDDLRESPMVTLIEMLIGKGYQVAVYDGSVSLAQLHGANRAYIEREVPHIASLMRASAGEVMDGSEVIVIGNRAAELAAALAQVRADQVVIDLVRIVPAPNGLAAQYEGICW